MGVLVDQAAGVSRSRRAIRLVRRVTMVAGSGASFALFGAGGLLLAMLFPLLNLCTPLHRRRVVGRRVLGYAFGLFTRIMRWLAVIDVRVHHLERLQLRSESGAMSGCIVAPNHPSLIDVVMLLGAAPHLDCVVKSALFKNPFTAGAVRGAGYLNNHEGPDMLDACAAELARGESILIFPEGTRSVPGQALQLKRGCANVALHAQAPIIPVTIHCNPAVLSKQQRWYDLPARRVQIDIDIHPHWSTADYLRRYGHRGRAARALTSDLNELFIRTLREGPVTGERNDVHTGTDLRPYQEPIGRPVRD